MLQPRPYQLEDLNRIQSRYEAGVPNQLVKWATGLGKTIIIATLRDHMGFTGRKMVAAHRDELIKQAYDKLVLWNPGVPIGIEKAFQHCGNEPIVVSSVQTIGHAGSPRLLKFDPMEFDALVIDEAHHSLGASYLAVIKHFQQNPKLLLLGVTATVNRADGKGLGDVYNEIVADRDILFGINNGWLVDLCGIRIKTKTDIDDVKVSGRDFEAGSLAHKLDNPARNNLIVESWLEHARDLQTVMFCANIDHGKHLAEEFRAHGVDAEAVWGDDPHRAKKLADHKAGRIHVICNCDVLVEGYDDWHIACIGMARSTKSEGKYVQMVGRGTRIEDGIGNLIEALARGYQGKTKCVLLDFVDATSKHSLITLPTLFGLNKDMDLKGKPITQVLKKVEEIKAKSPDVNCSVVTDVDKLESYAEQVDLFKVQFSPEVIQLSEYMWHKTGDNAYVLLLKGGDSVTVVQDMLDKWHVVGQVNDYQLMDEYKDFNEAIKEADYRVQLLGGRSAEGAAKRRLSKDDGDPSPAQRLACRQMGLQIPAGAKFGEVRAAMSKAIVLRKQNKVA